MQILMIEDDRALCAATKISLERAGHIVEFCHNGSDGLNAALSCGHDLLLVDRMLPGLDGLSLIAALRRRGIKTAALIITALSDIHDRVDGLDAGADDYLVKPFVMEELLARIRALGRRPNDLTMDHTLAWHDMVLNPESKTLRGPCGECSLSAHECALLEALLRAAGQILPRPTLIARVWGGAAQVEEGNLDSYIHFIRRRIRTVGSSATIKTAYGVGYRMKAPPC